MKQNHADNSKAKEKAIKSTTPIPLNPPLSATSPSRLKVTIQDLGTENKKLKAELKSVKEKLKNCSVSLQKDLSAVFEDNDINITPFINLFWEQ